MHFNVLGQKLYAWNGSGWGNGIARGTIGTLTTAEGTVNVSQSSIQPITNGYRLNVSFTPNANFTGTFVVRALAQDAQPVSGCDLDSLREGSVVTIAAPTASTTASKTAPSGDSS